MKLIWTLLISQDLSFCYTGRWGLSQSCNMKQLFYLKNNVIHIQNIKLISAHHILSLIISCFVEALSKPWKEFWSHFSDHCVLNCDKKRSSKIIYPACAHKNCFKPCGEIIDILGLGVKTMLVFLKSNSVCHFFFQFSLRSLQAILQIIEGCWKEKRKRDKAESCHHY